MYNQFSTREQAIFWITLTAATFFFAIGLFNWKVRESLKNIIVNVTKELTSPRLLFVFGTQAIYITILWILFYKMDLWKVSLVDEFTVFCFTSIPILFHFVGQNPFSFNQKALRLISKTVFLEQILDEFTLPLQWEIGLVLFVSILVIAQTYRKTRGLSSRRLDTFIVMIGLGFLIASVVRVMTNVNSYEYYNVIEFLTPIALPILFLPFVWFIILFVGYDSLLSMAKKKIVDKKYRRIFILGCFLEGRFNPKILRRIKINMCIIDYSGLKPTNAPRFLKYNWLGSNTLDRFQYMNCTFVLNIIGTLFDTYKTRHQRTHVTANAL